MVSPLLARIRRGKGHCPVREKSAQRNGTSKEKGDRERAAFPPSSGEREKTSLPFLGSERLLQLKAHIDSFSVCCVYLADEGRSEEGVRKTARREKKEGGRGADVISARMTLEGGGKTPRGKRRGRLVAFCSASTSSPPPMAFSSSSSLSA